MSLRFVFSVPPPPQPPLTPYVWFDFTDITQLFQDTAGLTPVTADGQAVNSVTDKGTLGTTAATDHIGTTNAPDFNTGLIDGFSGLTFDQGNSEGLVTDADVDLTATTSTLVVWRATVVPGVTGSVFVAPDFLESFRYFIATTSLIVRAADGKTVQTESPFPGGLPVPRAGWVIATAAASEVSINSVSGTVTTAAGLSDPAAGRAGIGVGNTGTLSHVTGQILECIIWRDGNPTQAQLETYVTDKYASLSWA